MNSLPCHPSYGIPPGLQLLQFKCSVYIISLSNRGISISKGWEKHRRKELTGGLLSSQRFALPALAHSKDLEEIGRSWEQVNDFSKRASSNGQSLAVLARAIDRDCFHPIARHLALGWGPHDGDLDIGNLHKLQIFGRRNFIWKGRGRTTLEAILSKWGSHGKRSAFWLNNG